MNDVDKIFAAGRNLDSRQRGEVNDEAIAAMLELMSNIDRIKHELNLLETSDPRLLAWHKATSSRVAEIAAEIEAGT